MVRVGNWSAHSDYLGQQLKCGLARSGAVAREAHLASTACWEPGFRGCLAANCRGTCAVKAAPGAAQSRALRIGII